MNEGRSRTVEREIEYSSELACRKMNRDISLVMVLLTEVPVSYIRLFSMEYVFEPHRMLPGAMVL